MPIIATLKPTENGYAGSAHSIASIPLNKLIAWDGNVRDRLPAEERIKHVYRATDDLLTNARNVVSSESEGLLSHLQFTQQNNGPKV